MVDVKLYGQKTSTYQYLKMLLMKRTKSTNVNIHLQEIDKIDDFITDNIISIPSIRVNDQTSLEYGKSKHMNDYLQKVFIEILKEEDFGNMKKIIVPTDFSTVAENAMVYALGLAKSFDSVVKVIHSYMPKTSDINAGNLYNPEGEKNSENKLDNLVKELKKQNISESESGFLLDSEFMVGAPIEKLTNYFNDYEEEIYTVMGSTGESGGFKRIFGSVSTEIIKKSKQPTFIIPSDAEFNGYKNIAIALDEFKLDNSTILWLTDFAKKFDANIHFVHVDKTNKNYPLEEVMNTAKNHYPDNKLNSHTIQSNNIVEALDEFSEENKMDLLIFTKGERGFLKSLFHHSVTKEMSQKTNTPLLVIHNQDK